MQCSSAASASLQRNLESSALPEARPRRSATKLSCQSASCRCSHFDSSFILIAVARCGRPAQRHHPTAPRRRRLPLPRLHSRSQPMPAPCAPGAMASGSAPYTVRLDAESARELAQRGGTILLLDVPEHTAIGIDQQARAGACAGCVCSCTCCHNCALCRCTRSQHQSSKMWCMHRDPSTRNPPYLVPPLSLHFPADLPGGPQV